MSWLETNPNHRAILQQRGLSSPEAFMALTGVILGGHPDRHVLTVEVEGLGQCFLKKEHRVRWKSRLGSWWSGCGWSSKSTREARLLQAIHQAGLAAPEVVAVGEVDQQSFLLMRAMPKVAEVREYLAALGKGGPRAEAASWLGWSLAQFITAGFYHPDLFCKHVLVQETEGERRLALVDWQRGRKGRRLSRRAVLAMLSPLDATWSTAWASDRDKLRFLRSLLLELGSPWPLKTMARFIRRRAVVLWRQRRIREMAQNPLSLGRQNLIWLDGEALCVTREFQAELGSKVPDWLRVSLQKEAGPAVTQTTITWKQRTLTLVRRWTETQAARQWRRKSKFPAPEFAQAGALFRLERFHLPLPRLLAVGHRAVAGGGQTSFLLTEPSARAMPLSRYFVEAFGPRERRRVLGQVGALLHRMHQAGYCLAANLQPWHGLGVDRLGGDQTQVVLMRVDGLQATRGDLRRTAQRDLRIAASWLPHRTDVAGIFFGYWNLIGLRRKARSWRRRLSTLLSAPRSGGFDSVREGGVVT